jgi:hypothetical protein
MIFPEMCCSNTTRASLGGTGQNYAANLAANRAAHEQAQHPADAFAGNLAGAVPLLAGPGVGSPGRILPR